jgi:predicted PurR-regulated permease PerM
MASASTESLRSAAVAIIAFGVVLIGLVYGRSFLITLAIAIFLWNVLEAMIPGLANLKICEFKPPRWLATILGLATTAFGFYLILTILLGQVDAITAAWSRYIVRFESIVSDLAQWLGPEWAAKVKQSLARIDLTTRVPQFIASTQSIVISSLLVVAYVAFLFAERGQMRAKIVAMFPDEARADETNALLLTISASVQRYIWLKTLVSALTGILCYAILRLQGVDFAETWALLIFVLNYIPNIGSIIGVAFPALLAMVQFETLVPFFVLVISLTAIQIAIGSVLEPMLMGKGLNMSPLAIVVSLAFWGTVWGIAGMFLCVPIIVVVMIVCAHVPSWRWIAVLLSKDGNVTA